MKPPEIKALFPITVSITQEMIEAGIYADRQHCIGANALRNILPTELASQIDWGASIGRVGGVAIRAKTKVIRDGKEIEEDIYIQKSSIKPITIKFIVDKR